MTYKNFEALIKLVETLRGENGCPWDLKQTPQTMVRYLAEEVYELMDAIESGKPEEICEELGDVFFHIIFIARLFQETGDFDIEAVASRINEKMIRRHPHIFGDKVVNNAEEVKKQWQKIKKQEKSHLTNTSLLDSVPAALPPLVRAYKISECAARVGFDWEDITGVMQKAEEEWDELKAELEKTPTGGNGTAMEFGDLLFSLVNVARFARIHPETALAGAVKKFENRFKYMENAIGETGKNLETTSMQEMDRLWEDAKKLESNI